MTSPTTSTSAPFSSTTPDILFPDKVAVVGAGSFGSAMTWIVSKAAQEQSSNTSVACYGRRQSVVDEINTQRTNEQYFPGVFSDYVEATTDIHECIRDAKVVFLAVPITFLLPQLDSLKKSGCLSEGAIIVSLLKSLVYYKNERKMITSVDLIKKSIPGFVVTALSGPNLYAEMASDNEFAEATIGYDENEEPDAHRVKMVTSSKCFQTSLTNDRVGLEVCAGLKNVISLAVGYIEGLGLGWNARSAMIRAGMHEMARFIVDNNMGRRETVFATSGGAGDLILTCTVGRGRKLAAAFVQYGLENGVAADMESSVAIWEKLEGELLNGMKLPDWHNAQYVYHALVDKGTTANFPVLDAVYKIGFEGHHPQTIVDALSKSIILADS
jgi:glycerol-3-phosphate dehydrogenase (NAD+)